MKTFAMIVLLMATPLMAQPWGGEYDYGPGQNLADIVFLTPSDGLFIVGNGSNFVGESGNTARTSLGLGTGDSPAFTNLYLQEVAAASADSAGLGQFWVLDTNPNEPWFTDGDGTDRQIPAGTNTDHFQFKSGGQLDFSDGQDTNLHTWQGSFLEQIDFTISVSGPNVIGSLEKENGGDLTMYFSDEFTLLDATPAITVELTALVGIDTSPATAFVYIPQSTKILTAAGSWPAESVEHIRVASLILQSAATTSTDKALMNRNWNDFSFGITDPRGGAVQGNERMRFEHALWASGVVLSIAGDTTSTIQLATTAGTVYQLRLHTFPAIDMATTGDIHLVNLSGSEYSTSVNLVADITTLADPCVPLANNKYFNIVIWGVQNRTGEASHLMCNLPTGQYNTSLGGTTDSSKFSVHTIPVAFRGTGFLIAELTFKLTGGGSTWTLVQNTDLLGQTPTLVPGGGTTTAVSIFPDSSFELFATADDTKEGVFDLSGITTGNVRTLTWPDTSSTIITSNGFTNFSGVQTFDAGAIFNGDVHFDGADTGDDALWDKSENTFNFSPDAKLAFNSVSVLNYWDGGGASWETTTSNEDQPWNIGSAGTGFLITITDDTGGTIVFTWSGDPGLHFTGTSDLYLDSTEAWFKGTARARFGDTGLGSIRYDPCENSGEMIFSTGSGKIMSFQGAGHTRFEHKLAFTQVDGNEYIDSLNDGFMDYRATTEHRFNNDIEVTGDVGATSITVGTANGGTINKTNIGGSDPCAVTAGILTVNTSAALDGSYVWFGNTLTISDADDPCTAYNALIADTTHGMGTISTTNRRVLRFMSGNYVVPSKWVLDTTFVDLKGLGATPFDVVIRATGNQFGPAIEQTADDIRLSNFTVSHDGTGFGIDNLSATGDHAFVVNVSSMTAPRAEAGAIDPTACVYTNMRFDHGIPARNGNAISILGADDIEGRWIDCWGNTFSWNMIASKTLNGEWFDCEGDFGGFEDGVEIGGIFWRCRGTFGGSAKDGCKCNSSSKFFYCEGDSTLKSFALGHDFAGYAYFCNSNSVSGFGGTVSTSSTEGDLTGTTIGCTTEGGSSYGMNNAKGSGNSIQSGVITNCRNGTAGDYAAGRSGARPSVVTDNGTAGSVTIDPTGADNDITFTSRFKSSSDDPQVRYMQKGGAIAIAVVDFATFQLIQVKFNIAGESVTAANITDALDASDAANAIMTWTAGGAGTMPDDGSAEDVFPLTGGVNTVSFSGNYPTTPSSHAIDATIFAFDNGHTYNNEGATEPVTLTLPAVFPSAIYIFEDVDDTPTVDLNIDLDGADHFVKPDGTAMAAGEQYQSENDTYGKIKVKRVAANTWQILDEVGTWAEETP
jgi:hypothetical protein